MDTLRLPAARPRTRGLPRVAWVLVASAFLCGGLLSAAGFSVGWRHQAQRSSSAEAALAAQRTRAEELSSSLAAARHAERSLRTERDRAVAATRTVGRRAAALAATLTTASRSAGPVADGAASVGADVARLTSELRTLTGYLESTPPSQVDAGFVATQASYLTKAIGRLGAASGSLASAVAAYERAAKAAAAKAATLRPSG